MSSQVTYGPNFSFREIVSFYTATEIFFSPQQLFTDVVLVQPYLTRASFIGPPVYTLHLYTNMNRNKNVGVSFMFLYKRIRLH
jgi:hypothetical protein